MKNKDTNSKYYIHPEGWKFAFFFCYIFLGVFIYAPISYIGYLLTLFTLWFFRNPKRNTPKNPNAVISSADGKVCLIDQAIPFFKKVDLGSNQMLRICVFMNVFNVHINRSPVEGRIDNIIYKNTKFSQC